MLKTYIFDLDGVIVNTAIYHYLAWKNLAERLGITFTKSDNERLKGVSRVRSFEIILEVGNKEVSQVDFERYLEEKNRDYLTYINKMDQSEILPGVMDTLQFLKDKERKLAVGSSSKNAKTIVEKIALSIWFDAIVDGNDITRSKPDPEVFLLAAESTNSKPEECVVFEDAEAGIEAANAAGMCSIGIGSENVLTEADYVFAGLHEISNEFLSDLCCSI
jgi:beta-phosphoglucomutase